MCVGGTPDVPTVPERQASKLPDGGNTASRTQDALKRRRALMATVLTGPNGVLGNPSVTAQGMSGKLGV
jgi:hypothetical protein